MYSFEFSEKSRKQLLTQSIASESDLRSSFTALQHCAPLGGPPFQPRHTPFIFSLTLSRLSKDNAHFLCAKQRSLLLCLLAPQCNITIQERFAWDPPMGSGGT